MRRRKLRIYKSSGQVEPYSRKKLYNSLRRTGLDNRSSLKIADKVSHDVGEGTNTRDIYRKTLKLVKASSPVAAVHYSLKRAIFELGPSGHNFEEYVARYFEELGFKTRNRLIFRGKWVKHEVDVLIEKASKRYFVECKFHNRPQIKNDIKTVLYVKARWDDLKEGPEKDELDGFFLASNTAFTSDAIAYSDGNNLKLLGVNAPVNDSFLDQIKRMRLYPVTSLRRLNKQMKEIFLSQNVILAKEIPDNLDILIKMGLGENEIIYILDEIELLKESKI